MAVSYQNHSIITQIYKNIPWWTFTLNMKNIQTYETNQRFVNHFIIILQGLEGLDVWLYLLKEGPHDVS